MARGTQDIAPLAGKVAIVAGGTDGLGREVALSLSQKGASVVIADRNVEGGARSRRRAGRSSNGWSIAALAAHPGVAA